jgi:molybdenum cofactor cytidylyltransferase
VQKIKLPKISAIILAAGKSSRMKTPKPLLNWGEEKLINFQIESLKNSNIEEIIVVIGSNAEEIKNKIISDEVKVVENVDFELGKTTSIKKGLSEINNKNDILLIAVDQPRNKLLIEQISDFHINHPENKKIIMPFSNGKSGHPIIFSNVFFNELTQINEETEGIREVIKRNQDSIIKYKTKDESALIDLNTPEQYEEYLLNHFK